MGPTINDLDGDGIGPVFFYGRGHRVGWSRLGAVIPPVGLAIVGDVSGLVVGLLLGVIWLVASVPVLVAVAHAMAPLVFPASNSVWQFLGFESVLVVLLILSTIEGHHRLVRLLVTGGCVASFGLITAVALELTSVPVAAVLLVGVIVTIVYAVHRLELYGLGLLPPADPESWGDMRRVDQ